MSNLFETRRAKFLVVALAVACASCGTFELTSGVIPLGIKTSERQQLDDLGCKDQAKLEANTVGRQTVAFVLGLTIVLTPVALEIEKSKQRAVYKGCMEARGYRVLPPGLPPGDGVTNAARNSESVTAAAPSITSPSTPSKNDEAAQLQKLQELRNKGFITEDECQQKRKVIVSQL